MVCISVIKRKFEIDRVILRKMRALVVVFAFIFSTVLTTVSAQPGDCWLPPMIGPCSEATQKFYYSRFTGDCEMFIYSGCHGNANNFDTVEECRDTCLVK
ncbi:kunitz-type serine protease inhibitor taicotoxin [Plakobranchus ocellatus]|uniref:Kunitz-type serine protease inhibitor taicotoxin n=1 Tax=Plakobranchus ocellatus TaxID=259542 RepID=A0AAV4AQL1_9GAST|nr:kunitz-type serine protease inhibitor taicotoxin [Plakobranchus ocellatus]